MSEQVPYDAFSEAYAKHSQHNAFQELYDRPAILRLAGDVSGKSVLDVGCAAGYLSKKLANAGANVIGIDASKEILAYAKAKHGKAVQFQYADLKDPLDFLEDSSIDVITASLVLHYLRDWSKPLAEFRRALKSNGILVISVHHSEDWHWFDRPNYFKTEQVSDIFEMDGQRQEVRFYRRPLSKTFDALRQAGFTIDHIDEPMPDELCKNVDPKAYEILSTRPRFLYFRCVSS